MKQFVFQSQAELSEVSRLRDWTIPDNQYIARPSLLRVVGINDPNDIGEVRISFGAFMAAGSEELGSLSRMSPDRPRVCHFVLIKYGKSARGIQGFLLSFSKFKNIVNLR